MMRSQQRKIEEQRTIIEHLRQRLQKEEKSEERSQITPNLWVPCIHNLSVKNYETLIHNSDNIPVNVVTNDSDSAINTDSGSDSSKPSKTDSTLIEAKLNRKFSHLEETTLSRSLSDLHMCKHMREQYLRKRQTNTAYANHRSVQRPRDVKKRHWRKSALGIETFSEETFKQ